MKKQISPYFLDVGFEESDVDGHLTILARSNSVKWACRLGVPECVQSASIQFSEWKQITPTRTISRHQKSLVLCTGIENGSADDWDYAYDRFLNPRDSSERTDTREALGCSKNGTIHLK